MTLVLDIPSSLDALRVDFDGDPTKLYATVMTFSAVVTDRGRSAADQVISYFLV